MTNTQFDIWFKDNMPVLNGDDKQLLYEGMRLAWTYASLDIAKKVKTAIDKSHYTDAAAFSLHGLREDLETIIEDVLKG